MEDLAKNNSTLNLVILKKARVNWVIEDCILLHTHGKTMNLLPDMACLYVFVV